LSAAGDFVYSQDNLSHMANFHKKLIQLYNESNSEVESLKTRLEQLFARLDIEEDVRNDFWRDLNGNIPERKDRLMREIENYELLKKSSMEKIIKNIRKDIDAL